MPCHGIASWGTPSGAGVLDERDGLGRDELAVLPRTSTTGAHPKPYWKNSTPVDRGRVVHADVGLLGDVALRVQQIHVRDEVHRLAARAVRVLESSEVEPDPGEVAVEEPARAQIAVVVRLRVDPRLALHHHGPAGEAGALAVDHADQRSTGTPNGRAGSRPRGARPSRRRAPAGRRRRAPRGTSGGAARGATRRSRAAGSADTTRSSYSRNASISRAWTGRWRSVRTSARVRGNRHATSETNSSVVISTNHHDPYTSNSPRSAVERADQRVVQLVPDHALRRVRPLRAPGTRPPTRAPASAAGSARCASSAGCATPGPWTVAR